MSPRRALWIAPVLALSSFACSSVSPDPGLGDPGTNDSADASLPPPPVQPAAAKMYVHTKDTLYTVDDIDFELTEIGAFFADESITDLAVTPDGRIFAISGESLYLVNPNNGLATFIAAVPGELNVGLTFLPSGQLLATDKDGGVREVSPDSGAVTEVGKFGNGWGTAGDLVAVADGTMFAIGEEQAGLLGDPNLLLTVNTGSGSANLVGEIGFDRVYGTAYAGGKVYAFTDGGEIIQIEPSTGQGTLVKTHAGVSFWGAAVTPLVSVE